MIVLYNVSFEITQNQQATFFKLTDDDIEALIPILLRNNAKLIEVTVEEKA